MSRTAFWHAQLRYSFLSALIVVHLLASCASSHAAQEVGNPKRDTSPKPPEVKSLIPIALDLRDAPLRYAFALLFTAARVDWSLGPDPSRGFVTFTTRAQPLTDTLDLLTHSTDVPLAWQRLANDVYTVRPEPSSSTEGTPAPATKQSSSQAENSLPAKTGNKRNALFAIPRRTAGIAFSGGNPVAAILIYKSAFYSEDDDFSCEIVGVGTKVPSGVEGVPDLRVESITSRQVVLRVTSGDNGAVSAPLVGTRVVVPLQSLAQARENKNSPRK